MPSFVHPAPNLTNADEIKKELKSYLYKVVKVLNDQMIIDAIRTTTPLGLVLYKGIDSHRIASVCPKFAAYLAPLIELYGEPKNHNFWVGTPKSISPASCYSEFSVKLWIPLNSPAGSKIEWYNYSGELDFKEVTNNDYDVISAYFPKTPKDLQLAETVHLTEPSWCKADKFMSMSNWSNELALYSVIGFSDQEKLSKLFE